MSLSVSLFPDTAPIRNALAIAEAYPNSVSSLEPNVFYINEETGERFLETDTFVIGRNATFSSATFQNVHTISCKTFLSLGNIKFDKLKVVADRIVLVNSVDVDDLELRSKTNFVAIGCMISGKEKLKISAVGDVVLSRPILNHKVEYEDTLLDGIQIGRRIVREWHEDPIDASIRDIRIELDKQDSWDLYEYTKEVAASMGMTPILIPDVTQRWGMI